MGNLRRKIEQAIESQIEEKGLNKHTHYKDLVKDYMKFWDIKNSLIKDIDDRGVSVKYQNGPDQWGYKKNDSISELLKVNKQMLTILYDLGIRASDLKVAEKDVEL